ncbi:PIG-L deacetylase family protein [Almyronema epifaneia]|uniref:PIG-L deacetylase family protein n=1 Tax=Almyronema epifaneia S1 TaxID=2991925 RepID=A0ABW6IM34_9CYAN
MALETGDRALPSTAITDLALHPAETALASCQQAIAIAPHPDDETLGCGGAIALLRQRSVPVRVLVVSDGSGSHPHSQHYPAPRLKKLRQQETIAALQILGVPAAAITFLGWPDKAVPQPGSPHFGTAVANCRRYLRCHQPALLFVPWQHDHHRDHRATWQIVQSALQGWPQPPRQLAYAVWGSPAAGLPALPGGTTGWRLDIRSVMALKQQAALAHQSQTTDLIADDPTGFRLTPAMLANLIQPWETYLEESS